MDDIKKGPLQKITKQQKVYTRFSGDTDQAKKTESFVAKCTFSNEVGKIRKDFQPITGKLQHSAILSKAKSHETKITAIVTN